MDAPGQDSGHAAPGLDWSGYVKALVEERGSLTALAEHLAAQRGFADDVGTVERGLRRLRTRGHRDGGIWGRRLIAACGLPIEAARRVRWMGFYHSRFTDLPTSVCHELLQLWDRPPVSETSARVWIQLGMASVALRRRNHDRARLHLERVERIARPPDADVELALTRSFLHTRSDHAASVRDLQHADEVLHAKRAAIEPHHWACLNARLVDQQAYRLNRPRDGEVADHEGALRMYASIPDDGPAFARCRHHNGMGWSLHRLGRTDEATAHARASMREAGDSGSLRLRAMALNLLSRCLAASPDEAAITRERAQRIAQRLEDEELMGRYGRPDP